MNRSDALDILAKKLLDNDHELSIRRAKAIVELFISEADKLGIVVPDTASEEYLDEHLAEKESI